VCPRLTATQHGGDHRVAGDLEMQIRSLGLMRYSDALSLMEECHLSLVQNPALEDVILIVEHLPVVTMGLRERSADLITPEQLLKDSGVDFQRIDRGGSVTVHEPGQLVLYPLIRVDSRFLTVRRLVWALEEIMILECARWGIEAARDSINPGVWVGRDKVGAIGVRVSNHVSKHGLALNVRNSLQTFSHIIPCGIQQRGVASLAQLNSILAEESLLEMGQRMAADLSKIISTFRESSDPAE